MHILPQLFVDFTLAAWVKQGIPPGVPNMAITSQNVKEYLTRQYIDPKAGGTLTDGGRFIMLMRQWMIQSWALHAAMDTSESTPMGHSLVDTHDEIDRLILQGYSDYYLDLFHFLVAGEQFAYDSGIVTGQTLDQKLSKFSGQLTDPKFTASLQAGITVHMRPAPSSADSHLGFSISEVPPMARLAAPYTTSDSELLLKYIAALHSNIGMSYTEHARMEYQVLSIPPEDLNRLSPSLVNRRPLDPQMSLQSLLRNQLMNLNTELFIQGKERNTLKGRGTDENLSRILLDNEAIPKPTIGTILAWWTHCAIAPAWKNKDGRIYIAFTLPQLPETTEHRNGGSVQTGDSTSSHSLTIRSNSHWRNEYGGLYLGEKLAWLASRGPDGDWCIHSEIPLSGMERPNHIFSSLRVVFPHIRPPSPISYIESLSPRVNMHALFADWKDPWQDGNGHAMWNWHTTPDSHMGRTSNPLPHQVDDPWRAYAKMGLYMRFHHESKPAIKEWVKSFLASVGAYLDSNPTQLLTHTFNERNLHANYNPSATVKKKAKDGTSQTFNFSGFMGG